MAVAYNPGQEFVFTHLDKTLRSWTSDGQPVNKTPSLMGMQRKHKKAAFSKLATLMHNNGACELAAEYIDRWGNPQIMKIASSKWTLHAEENLIQAIYETNSGNYTTKVGDAIEVVVEVRSMIISLEPCHKYMDDSNKRKIRYPKHQCIDLFNGGRAFQGEEKKLFGRFKPIGNPTFVFFVQEQTVRGGKAEDWKNVKMNEQQDFMVAMKSLAGPDSVPVFRLGSMDTTPKQPSGDGQDDAFDTTVDVKDFDP